MFQLMHIVPKLKHFYFVCLIWNISRTFFIFCQHLIKVMLFLTKIMYFMCLHNHSTIFYTNLNFRLIYCATKLTQNCQSIHQKLFSFFKTENAWKCHQFICFIYKMDLLQYIFDIESLGKKCNFGMTVFWSADLNHNPNNCDSKLTYSVKLFFLTFGKINQLNLLKVELNVFIMLSIFRGLTYGVKIKIYIPKHHHPGDIFAQTL